MIKRFHELQDKISRYYPDANFELLKKAYSVAAAAHINQKRKTKEPFIIHPLAVASTLADLKLDEISISAALLHDIVEDTDYTIERIHKMFGQEISDIVWGVTKISKISEFDAENARAETFKKMIVAMTNDVRVILIKLADRLHNIKTLDALDDEKKRSIAKETLEIYAPIAYRLGMGKIKDELEDWAFPYVHPEDYERIKKEVSDKKEWAFEQIDKLKINIASFLKEYQIYATIKYRIKREISIYRKLEKQNIELDQVYDLLALRLITDTVENCYVLMGLIHQKWRPLLSRWRDFIAHPKKNGYMSIHTTITTENGTKFEIQIRTNEMHRIAEEGIAAHWKYKEGVSFIEDDQRLHWFRDMIDFHKTNPNPKDFLNLVKSDLTPNEIYVFTPKGKVISLRKDASAIDFAYAIHSEIGEHCKGAIVNEHLVPLKTTLNSGDVIEIITAKNISPNSDWLKYVVTSKARKKIAAFLQKRDNLLYVEKGKKMWAKIYREYKRKFSLKLDEEDIMKRVSGLHYNDMDTFFRDVGSNKKQLDRFTLKKIFPEISTADQKPVRRRIKRGDALFKLVNVEGYQDIEVSFARCCAPIKGENIIGYITSNRGLVIHKAECPNIKNLLSSRVVNVNWNETAEYHYLVKYDLVVRDKPGMLNSISQITAKHESNITRVEFEKINQSTGKIKITFQVADINQLKKIHNDFERTKGVNSIIRKRIYRK